MKDYRATFSKNPLAFDIDIEGLKSGLYHVEGEADEASIQALNKRIENAMVQGLKADLDMKKSSSHVDVQGTIKLKMKYLCSVTGKPFKRAETVEVKDAMAIDVAAEGEKVDDVLTDTFDVGEFVSQQVLLSIDEFAVHPDVQRSEGNTVYADPLSPEELAEKEGKTNPFQVLEQLKTKNGENS
ncbi:MAG: YceD family protein [Pseudomonadota bacterium]|nr:YceD family protein [Pseudomonadota bacterium]